MRNVAAIAVLTLCNALSTGCSRSDSAQLAEARDQAEAKANAELARAKAELEAVRPGADSATVPTKPVEAQPIVPPRNPKFDESEMMRPVNLAEYAVDDYRKLPNCLDVFTECVAIPFEGKTEEQYKSALLEIAQRPCRMILNVFDVPADYDYAEFEILTDASESGLTVLNEGGNLGNYTRHLRKSFAINGVRAKKLDVKRLSIGDNVVLVGLGYVVAAAPWGTADPLHGMPRGDERHVTLRAFGKPHKYRPEQYAFAFMIRNWYIAEQ